MKFIICLLSFSLFNIISRANVHRYKFLEIMYVFLDFVIFSIVFHYSPLLKLLFITGKFLASSFHPWPPPMLGSSGKHCVYWVFLLLGSYALSKPLCSLATVVPSKPFCSPAATAPPSNFSSIAIATPFNSRRTLLEFLLFSSCWTLQPFLLFDSCCALRQLLCSSSIFAPQKLPH